MEFPRITYGRRGHKRFNYKPVFYDPDKEDLENRVEKAKAEMTGEFDFQGYKKRLEASFRNRQSIPDDPFARQLKMVSRIRFWLIAVVLGSLAYLVFYTNTISIIFEAFKDV